MDAFHVSAPRPVQHLSELGGAVGYEVEATAIARVDTRGRRPSEPLLRNDLALRPDCFTHDPDSTHAARTCQDHWPRICPAQRAKAGATAAARL